MGSITKGSNVIKYQIEYSQARLNFLLQNPIVWERKKETIKATDDVDAVKKAQDFLKEGSVEHKGTTYRREIKKLFQHHPHRVLNFPSKNSIAA